MVMTKMRKKYKCNSSVPLLLFNDDAGDDGDDADDDTKCINVTRL